MSDSIKPRMVDGEARLLGFADYQDLLMDLDWADPDDSPINIEYNER